MTPGLPSRPLNAAGVVSALLALLALAITAIRSIGWVISTIMALSLWHLAIVASCLLATASHVHLAGRARRQQSELIALRSQIATVRDQLEASKTPVISLNAARARAARGKAS